MLFRGRILRRRPVSRSLRGTGRHARPFVPRRRAHTRLLRIRRGRHCGGTRRENRHSVARGKRRERAPVREGVQLLHRGRVHGTDRERVRRAGTGGDQARRFGTDAARRRDEGDRGAGPRDTVADVGRVRVRGVLFERDTAGGGRDAAGDADVGGGAGPVHQFLFGVAAPASALLAGGAPGPRGNIQPAPVVGGYVRRVPLGRTGGQA
mmetsp:Transcript_20184/g.40182  ORF Transcript_20184/g.40182 Transcript_20184/m.40182 type:complete len:208 (+) Transcript_20184:248-871(+)